MLYILLIMKIQNFTIVITQDEDGVYMARVTTIPGCHTQAKTLPVLYDRVAEAITLCLEVKKKRNKRIVEDRFIGVQQIPIAV